MVVVLFSSLSQLLNVYWVKTIASYDSDGFALFPSHAGIKVSHSGPRRRLTCTYEISRQLLQQFTSLYAFRLFSPFRVYPFFFESAINYEM
jgi:hypothetical protein